MDKEPFHRHNFVISTGAYPDFPLRDAGPRMRLSVERAHGAQQRHRSKREIRGSAVERPAVFTFPVLTRLFIPVYFCRAILHDHIRNDVAVRSMAGSVVL